MALLQKLHSRWHASQTRTNNCHLQLGSIVRLRIWWKKALGCCTPQTRPYRQKNQKTFNHLKTLNLQTDNSTTSCGVDGFSTLFCKNQAIGFLQSLLQNGELQTQKFPIWNCPQYTQHTSHFPYLSCSCLTPLTASCWKPAAAASNLFSSSSSLNSWLDSRIERTQEPKLASCYNLTPTMTPNNISPPEADPPWLAYSKQFPRAPQPASIQNAPKRKSLSSSRNWSG